MQEFNDAFQKVAFGRTRAEALYAGKCLPCGKSVNVDDFVDEISRKEYNINGSCQKCQDEIFVEEEPPICPHCTRYPRKKIEDHTGDYYATWCVSCQHTIITYMGDRNRQRDGRLGIIIDARIRSTLAQSRYR